MTLNVIMEMIKVEDKTLSFYHYLY